MSRNGAQLSEHKSIAFVFCDKERLHAEFHDGRIVSVPLSWYPRLENASPEQRARWKLVGQGYGIHWPDMDEDISADMILNGIPSVETRHVNA